MLAKVIDIIICNTRDFFLIRVNISSRSFRYVMTLMHKFIFNAMLYIRGEFFTCKLFLCKTISNKMFYSNYKHIIDSLPESLIKKVCQRLLYHSKDPILLESISEKSERIESYLRHILEVYNNLLNRK